MGVLSVSKERSMKTCDLHTHSVFSDGTLTPEQLIQLAEKAGLSAVVLCDHNTVSGLPAFLEAGRNSPVEAIPGIEFSTDYQGKELHLIMLFVKPQDYAPITDLMEEVLQRKEHSMRMLTKALQDDGMPIDYDVLRNRTPDGYVNRAFVAGELVNQGYASSIKEAFQKYLKPGGGYYTPPQLPDIFEMIRFIHHLGGVSVLAHPFLNLDEDALTELLPQAKACGLDAMETIYSRYDEQTTQKARNLANRFQLLESGGSDFHGANKPDIFLGVGEGNLKVPLALLEKLKIK